MKFIHIADVHLGAKPEAGKAYSEKRANEIWENFLKIIDICEEKAIDLLLIAGDLFHRQPLLRELKEINYLFSKLTKTRVVLIAGNHDYIRKDSYYLSFVWNQNVYPLFSGELDYVEFPEINTCVYGFSYHSKEIYESTYQEQKGKRLQEIEILLLHGGDEAHVPLKKQELNRLEYDYIALGHIHKPMEIEKNRIYYAGAPEPLDKTETGMHGYVLGETKGTFVHALFVPYAKRRYFHEKIEVTEQMTGHELKEKVKERIKKQGVQNVYKIVFWGFRDPDILFDFEYMDIYGNIVEIIDETFPAYDFEKIERQNRGNLLGKFIEQNKGAEGGSIEALALYEGVQAILKSKRG